MAHRDPIVHTDGIKLKRHAARRPHRLLHHPPKLLKMGVAGNDVNVGIADSDKGLAEVRLVLNLAGRPQQAAVGRTLESALDRV